MPKSEACQPLLNYRPTEFYRSGGLTFVTGVTNCATAKALTVAPGNNTHSHACPVDTKCFYGAPHS